MKNFIKWKILAITCAVCLVPVIFGVLIWDSLPESIAIHFNMNNVPDNFASKTFTVFGMPALMVLLQVVCCAINDINAKKHGERKKFELATKWIIPVMTILLQGITFAYALGIAVDIRKSAVIIVSAVFLVIGNYMPKMDYIKNYDVNKEKARKINRFIGFESVIMGIIGIATVFLPPVTSLVWIFMLIPYAVVSLVYSVVVVKNN